MFYCPYYNEDNRHETCARCGKQCPGYKDAA
jgi:hypothetical protein